MWIQTHWRVLPTTCRTCPVMWWISTNTNSQNTNSFVLLTWRTSCAFSLLFLNHSNAWANTHTYTRWPEEKPSLPLSLVVLQYLGKLISSYIKASALDCCSEVSKYVAAAFNHFFLKSLYFQGVPFLPTQWHLLVRREACWIFLKIQRKRRPIISLHFSQPPATVSSP